MSATREDELQALVEANSALFEYEEARKEHEHAQTDLTEALDLKRKVTHYYTLAALLTNVEREGNTNAVKQSLEMSDILTGRQKRAHVGESAEVTIQKMRFENSELQQELLFWKNKASRYIEEDIGEATPTNSSRAANVDDSAMNSSQGPPRKQIKFSRRLGTSSKGN